MASCLTDQQALARILDFHLQRQRLVVASMTPESCIWCRGRAGSARRPGISSATPRRRARRSRRGRHQRLQFDLVGLNDPEQRRAFVVGGAERGHDFGDASGDGARSTKALPAAAPRRAERFVALREPRFRGPQPRFRDHRARRASSTRRAGTARSASSRSARACSRAHPPARPVPRRDRPPAWRDQCRPRDAARDARALAGFTRSPIEISGVGGKAAGRGRRDDRPRPR